MAGARIDSEIASKAFFNPTVSKEDVYVYTFGTIKVVDSDTNVLSGYENIHNIYNYYDAFGFRGNYSWTNASSANAKFGHTELFELDVESNMVSTENHWMSTYRDALEIEEIQKGFISSCN